MSPENWRLDGMMAAGETAADWDWFVNETVWCFRFGSFCKTIHTHNEFGVIIVLVLLISIKMADLQLSYSWSKWNMCVTLQWIWHSVIFRLEHSSSTSAISDDAYCLEYPFEHVDLFQPRGSNWCWTMMSQSGLKCIWRPILTHAGH